MTAIVQINFDYDSSAEKLLEEAHGIAPKFTGIDGLLWKIWLGNDTEKGTGGIYLFENRQKADKYLESDIVAMLRARANFEIKVFDVLQEPSVITRAPINAP